MNYSQYDDIAVKYDDLFRDESSLVENREVGAMLPPLNGSILDIGCGTGLLTEIYNVSPNDYLGIDPSKDIQVKPSEYYEYNCSACGKLVKVKKP